MPDKNYQSGRDHDPTYYAGFGRRIIATVIDLFILTIIAGVAVFYLGLSEGFRMLMMMIQNEPIRSFDGVLITAPLPGPVASFLLITLIIVPWLYYAVLEASKNQATLGKMAARIVVTDLQGNQITFTRASLRHFSKFLSAVLLFSGFFAIIYTRNSQGLHDVIAACLVLFRPEKIG